MAKTTYKRHTGKEAARIWSARIQNAIQWRQDYWNGDKAWKRAYKALKGKHWSDRETDWDLSSDNPRDKITVNVVQSNIETMLPFLVNDKAKFKADARKPDGFVSAMLQESVLNYEYQRKKMHPELKKVVKDAITIGHGVAKTGFTRTLDKAALVNAGAISYEDYITDESTYVKRVNPCDFYFDPNAADRNIETARWVCERYYKYSSDIMVNTRYDQKVLRKLRDGEYRLTTIDLQNYDENWINLEDNNLIDYTDQEDSLAILYEVWDKKYDEYWIFADGCEEPLLHQENPYEYLEGGHPYRMLTYIYLPDEWYGIGIPAQIEDMQYELNRHRTFAYNHRRRFSARKYLALQGLDDDELDKLQYGEDGTFVKVPNMDAIKALDAVPLPDDYGVLEGLIKSDIQETTGIDNLMRGGPLKDRTTAGEVGTRASIFGNKLGDRIERVDQFWLDIGGDLNGHISANYLKENVIRIVGAQGEYWVNYSNEDLKAEVIWTMKTLAAPKTDPSMNINQRIQYMQTVMSFIPIMLQTGQPVPIDFVQMMRWVLESFGETDTGRFFRSTLMPIPPPTEVSTMGEVGQSEQGPAATPVLNPQDLMAQIGGAANSPFALMGQSAGF